jgi:uncharacterized membrane protein YkvA (DUF1232 family)
LWEIASSNLVFPNRTTFNNQVQLFNRINQGLKQLKSQAQVLMIAYKDKRTPAVAKILIGITVGYLLSPIDLIPDFIPVLGLIDDIIIVPALIALSIKLIPETVLTDARDHLKSHPQQFKKNNWLFAALIVIIWIAVLYFVFVQAKGVNIF